MRDDVNNNTAIDILVRASVHTRTCKYAYSASTGCCLAIQDQIEEGNINNVLALMNDLEFKRFMGQCEEVYNQQSEVKSPTRYKRD